MVKTLAVSNVGALIHKGILSKKVTILTMFGSIFGILAGAEFVLFGYLLNNILAELAGVTLVIVSSNLLQFVNHYEYLRTKLVFNSRS